MDAESTLAETLPTLYRAILDRIAIVERLGERREAQLVRLAATTSYATAWDDRTHRRLLALHRRLDRVIAGHDRPRRRRPLLELRRAALFGR